MFASGSSPWALLRWRADVRAKRRADRTIPARRRAGTSPVEAVEAGAPAHPAGGAAGSSGGASGSGGTSPYLPARIRRLTNAEYDASVQALLGTMTRRRASSSRSRPTPGKGLQLTGRRRVYGERRAAGRSRAREQTGRCRPGARRGSAGERQARRALALRGHERGGRRGLRGNVPARVRRESYRRLLSDEEVTGLVSRPGSAYHVGADGHTYEDGIDVLDARGAADARFPLRDRARRRDGRRDLPAHAERNRELAFVPSDCRARPTPRSSRRLRRASSPRPTGVKPKRGACFSRPPAARDSCASFASGSGSTTSRAARRRRASTRNLPASVRRWRTRAAPSSRRSCTIRAARSRASHRRLDDRGSALAAVYGLTPAGAGQRTSLAGSAPPRHPEPRRVPLGVRDQQRQPPRVPGRRHHAPDRVPRHCRIRARSASS